jgi:hypothetical protein
VFSGAGVREPYVLPAGAGKQLGDENPTTEPPPKTSLPAVCCQVTQKPGEVGPPLSPYRRSATPLSRAEAHPPNARIHLLPPADLFGGSTEPIASEHCPARRDAALSREPRAQGPAGRPIRLIADAGARLGKTALAMASDAGRSGRVPRLTRRRAGLLPLSQWPSPRWLPAAAK